MRVSSLGVARPAYYDRRATSVITTYNATVAPHGATTRATYTVAAGYKAIIEASGASTQTVLAPTAIGRHVAFIQMSTGTATGTLSRIDEPSSLTVSRYLIDKGSGTPTLYAGEYTEILTLDDSTGGSINYEIFAKMTLFAA